MRWRKKGPLKETKKRFASQNATERREEAELCEEAERRVKSHLRPNCWRAEEDNRVLEDQPPLGVKGSEEQSKGEHPGRENWKKG